MPEILVRGEAFLKKFRMCAQYWARTYPHEFRAFCEAVKCDRDNLINRNGASRDGGDLGYNGALPKFIMDNLRLSEWQTQFMYGQPFGTGDTYWDTDDELYRMAMREFLIGKVSNSRGAA